MDGLHLALRTKSPAPPLSDTPLPDNWTDFATADGMDALGRSWLALQCAGLDGVLRAMLVVARPGGPFQPIAAWPTPGTALAGLQQPAEACIRSGEPEIRHPPHDGDAGDGVRVAYPFLADNHAVAGAVVLDLLPGTDLPRTLRALHWGIGWLEAQAVRDRMARDQGRTANLSAALDLVALANEHDRADGMAIAVANELAARIGASRVVIGLRADRGAHLLALSHTAWFKRKTGLARALSAAMDEAMEQRATVRLPASTDEAVRIQVAHEALHALLPNDDSLVTVPMPTDHGPVGAITVLHPGALPLQSLRLVEAVAALLGPGLEARHRARRWVSGRAVDMAADAMAALLGPRHLAWKLAGGAAVAAVVAAALVPMPFRVSAKAVLEGEVQRAVPAPFDGFVARAMAHAGDVVTAGAVLAALDDRDLQLDRVKWAGERERITLKLREAMAKHDPATVGQLQAQLRQTEAQARLTDAKLARAAITAPIDGIVMTGDLSHSIGAPVETGKVLFEIAPLDRYRVVVRVDERDLRFVQPGQEGTVLLYGMSGGALPFTVQRVTAVAQADGGRNTFRVDGVLTGSDTPERLRPGMEGVGKVEVGRRSVAAVWTRSLVDWARSFIWAWTP